MRVATYESNDGIIFTDPVDCASYELESMPDFIEKINLKFALNERGDYWCGGGPCGCMGCVNFTFYDSGLQEYHYLAWKRDYLVQPSFDREKPIKVFVENIGNYEDFKEWALKNKIRNLNQELIDGHVTTFDFSFRVEGFLKSLDEYKEFAPDLVYRLSN